MGWGNRLTIGFLLCFTFAFAFDNAVCAEVTKRVLILNSYHHGYSWSDDELDGLSAALGGKPEVEQYVEFGDAKRDSGRTSNQAWLAFLLTKYRSIPLDLLIATDDYGASRALAFRAALNPKLPIVFCGLNDYKGTNWILHTPKGAGLAGVLEKVTHLETASFALKLLPGTKEIIVVDPDGFFNYVDDLQSAFPGIHARCLESRKYTLNQLAAELEKLPPNSFVITSAFFSDSAGHATTMEYSIRWVTSHSAVPVFGISKRALGLGIVGGKLADGFFQGKAAGEMAASILGGKSPFELTNLTDAGEPYTVEYSAMKRWSLNFARLPAGSIVVGRPVTLYQEHKTTVWIVFWLLLIQFAVIGLLIFEIKTRKTAQEKLAITAQNYRAIFEQSPLGVVEIALDGRWNLANDKACEIVGDSHANRVGKTLEDLVSSEDWKRILQPRASLRKGTAASFSVETEFTQRSGRKLWVRRTSSLIRDAELRPKVVMVMLEDITRRKEAEQQLLRSNAALRHFAYAAAHDLQEPLRNVALASDLLMTDYSGNLDDVGQRLLCENLEGAHRMLGMVKALLDYSAAIDAPGRGLNDTVETGTALTQALQNLHAAIREANIEIFHSALPRVRANQVHVVALFQNLIGNSVKYRRKDGTAHVFVSAKPIGAEWIFEVSDDGIGFDAKYAERIFGVFKRLHSRREYPGTGIGLAICARIVEHYGGRIWAESKPLAGARFFFSLPAATVGMGQQT